MENLITLDTLRPKEAARVVSIDHEDPSLCRRLFAMGIVKGVEIEEIAESPLGDPVSVSLRGYFCRYGKRNSRSSRG